MRIPPRPPDLPKVFGAKFKEVGQALASDTYQRVIDNAQAKYRHWDKVRFLARQSKIDAEVAWALIAMARRTSRKTLPFQSTAGEQLSYTLPDIAQRELMLIDQQMGGQMLVDRQHPPDAQQRERFILSSLREEAISSSLLEGAATTRREAEEMLEAKRKPRNRGERMVLNNYRAIEFVRDHRHTPLTPEFVLELQGIVTRDALDRPDEAGRLRRAEEYITVSDPTGEVLHTPPPAAELESRLELLCSFANEATDAVENFIHPVVRAIAIHFQMAYDHPFCDGNGRTARALFYWAMLRHDYWLFEYLPISRLIYRAPVKYGRAFLYTETDNFDLTYFLVYKLRLIGQARRELAQYLRDDPTAQQNAASPLFPPTKPSVLPVRINLRQRLLLRKLKTSPSHPLTIEDHQRTADVAYGTARADLLDLASKGYLYQYTAGKRFEFLLTERGAEAAKDDSDRT